MSCSRDGACRPRCFQLEVCTKGWTGSRRHRRLRECRTSTGAIRTAFQFFSDRAATGFAVPEWLPTPANTAYSAAVRRLDAAVYGVIDRRAAELAAAPEQPPQARLSTRAFCQGIWPGFVRVDVHLELAFELPRGARAATAGGA